MLLLIDPRAHPFEIPFFRQLLRCFSINLKGAKGCGIEGMAGEGEGGEIMVVRGPEEEDAGGMREVEGGVCPGGGGAGVGVACMSGGLSFKVLCMRKKGEKGCEEAYGAMITRAPGIGRGWPLMEGSTWDSQPSSSEERVDLLELYHEPAWLATRVVILGFVNRL